MNSLSPPTEPKNARVHVKRHGKPANLKLRRIVHLFKAPAFALARAKHLFCFFYFSAMSVLYLFAAPQELRAVEAYAPIGVGIAMLGFASLHFHGLVQTCAFHNIICLRWKVYWAQHYRSLRKKLPQTWLSHASHSAWLTIFHLVDVTSQSYQAYRMSYYLTNRNEAFLFAFVVSLYCLITPWFLFARHEFVRQSLVILVDSYLGFFTSTAFPLIVFVIQALRLVVIDKSLQYDDKFVTVSLLIGRYIIVSSPLDMLTKFIIQLSSYLSLRRLVLSMHSVNQSHKTNQTSVIVSERESIHRVQVAKETFSLEFKSRRYLILYLIVNLIWGMSIIITATSANWFRDSCPSYCVFDTSPWFDRTCNCAYVEINCASSEFKNKSVEELIDPGVIGKSLFFLDIRRCALPHGISLSLLRQHQRLYALFITYSNMTDWTYVPGESFPASLMSLHIRGSNLSSVPAALKIVPTGLVFLRLQDSNITSIPDEFLTAWKGIYSLGLARLSLTTVPNQIATMRNLIMLELRGNNISYVSTEWQNQLVSSALNINLVDFSSNNLEHGLWKIVSAKRIIVLSSNPISNLPAEVDTNLITSKNIVLDGTPLCDKVPCESKCSRHCVPRLVGNHRCDLECLSPECSYDNGDCVEWGY